MLQLTFSNMHKIATEPSDSSWMKACRTNNSIRFSTHKRDTIEPVHTTNPSSQDQGQHKLCWKSAHTHPHHTHSSPLEQWQEPTPLCITPAQMDAAGTVRQLISCLRNSHLTYMLTFHVPMPGEYTAHNKANHWNLKQFIKYCYLIPVLYNLHILSKMCKNKEMRFLRSSQWTVLETSFTWYL